METRGCSETVSEEQFRGRQTAIVFGHLQHATGIAFDCQNDVVLQMNRAFGCAGTARNVQPECWIVFVGVRLIERRARTVEQRLERWNAGDRAIGDDEMLQTRQQMKAGQKLAGQRFAHDANGGARVVEDEPIVGFPQHRVDWDWNRTDLDSAQEACVERGTVVQEQDGALLAGKADGAQGIARAIHQRIELAVGDRRALGNQGNAIAASLAHVAGDEIVDDVEGVGDCGECLSWRNSHGPLDVGGAQTCCRR